MKYLIKMRIVSVLFIVTIMFFSLSCKKGSGFNEKLYGTWRITKANVHSVFSFRANGSWTSSNRVEGKFSRIIENKGKVVGQWKVKESDDEEDLVNLFMTPVTVESVKEWEVGKTVQFKIVNIDENQLVLLQTNGREQVWTRVRGKKTADDELAAGIVKVKTGPIVVNLKNLRAHGKFRYLCIDLDLSVEEADNCGYLVIETKQTAEEAAVYQLHPKIQELAIMHFSSLTYKETKTLDKVKETIKALQVILNPYFNGKLIDIHVIKVVVTSNIESVKDFENMYAQQEAEVTDS